MNGRVAQINLASKQITFEIKELLFKHIYLSQGDGSLWALQNNEQSINLY
jgi:hypothetical protein